VTNLLYNLLHNRRVHLHQSLANFLPSSRHYSQLRNQSTRQLASLPELPLDSLSVSPHLSQKGILPDSLFDAQHHNHSYNLQLNPFANPRRFQAHFRIAIQRTNLQGSLFVAHRRNLVFGRQPILVGNLLHSRLNFRLPFHLINQHCVRITVHLAYHLFYLRKCRFVFSRLNQVGGRLVSHLLNRLFSTYSFLRNSLLFFQLHSHLQNLP
jgi:hypothetical protein